MKIVVINGFPLSGKDTFVNFCIHNMSVLNKGMGFNLSTIDPIKSIAINLGWDGLKTDKDRKFLSDLKKLLTEWNDIPYKATYSKMNTIYNRLINQKVPEDKIIFFVHSREPEEIKRFKEDFGAKTLLVKKDNIDKEFSNESDKNVNNYEYDFIIENNGTLEELEQKAIDFLKELKL